MTTARATTLYVLKLANDCYYVGCTRNFKYRMQQHADCRASAWTRLHKIDSIISQEYVKCNIAGFCEDAKVLELMSKHGISKVRGGTYNQIVFSNTIFAEIKRKIWHNAGYCTLCGSPHHFVKRCKNRRIKSAEKNQ